MCLPGPIYMGGRWIESTSVEHSCQMPSMNDDVLARDVEGWTSFYAEKTAQSLYAQLGFRQAMFPDNWTKKSQETMPLIKRLKLGIKRRQLLEYLSGTRTCSGSAAMARPSDQSINVIGKIRGCVTPL